VIPEENKAGHGSSPVRAREMRSVNKALGQRKPNPLACGGMQ
jgi:hypothetical protein